MKYSVNNYKCKKSWTTEKVKNVKIWVGKCKNAETVIYIMHKKQCYLAVQFNSIQQQLN